MSSEEQQLFIKIIEIIWLLTVSRSIIIMLGGGKMFRKAHKKSGKAYVLLFNLFTTLDIAGVSLFLGVLFFVPVFNLIPLTIMSYKLGKVFRMGGGFTLGLIICPIIFYPLLFGSGKAYKVRDEDYFDALNSARKVTKKELPEKEIPPLEDSGMDEAVPEVDSIFKSRADMMEDVAPYKASRLKKEDLDRINALDNIEKDFHESSKIKKVETEKKKKNNKVEFIDL